LPYEQIILTCIPVLAPLFKFFSQKLSSNGYGSNGYTSNGYPSNGYASKGDRHRQSQGHNLQVLAKAGNATNTTSKISRTQRDATANDSQETILGPLGRDSDEGIQRGDILKTVRVEVQSTSREDDQERSRKHFV
jgi:hypothetical protein